LLVSIFLFLLVFVGALLSTRFAMATPNHPQDAVAQPAPAAVPATQPVDPTASINFVQTNINLTVNAIRVTPPTIVYVHPQIIRPSYAPARYLHHHLGPPILLAPAHPRITTFVP